MEPIIISRTLAIGQGGVLFQQVNRDNFQFACKCSTVQASGEIQELHSDKANLATPLEPICTIFYNGAAMNLDSFDAIRKRLAKY